MVGKTWRQLLTLTQMASIYIYMHVCIYGYRYHIDIDIGIYVDTHAHTHGREDVEAALDPDANGQRPHHYWRAWKKTGPEVQSMGL